MILTAEEVQDIGRKAYNRLAEYVAMPPWDDLTEAMQDSWQSMAVAVAETGVQKLLSRRTYVQRKSTWS